MDSGTSPADNALGYFSLSRADNYLGFSVAPGLLPESISESINSTVAGSFGKPYSCYSCRFGGVSMLLKLIVLSSASLTLWLDPLVGLDKRIGWHRGIQGVSLCAAVACAVRAGNLALKLASEAEIEAIKERAITADVVDEIAASAYVSQAQRQNEAELLIAGNGDARDPRTRSSTEFRSRRIGESSTSPER